MISVIALQMFIKGFEYGQQGIYFNSTHFYLDNSDVENIEECRNLGLVDTAFCMHSYVTKIYNYTVRDDTTKSSEDIKLNGGDCYDYANLYVSMAVELGYNGYVTAFRVAEGEGHAFAVISSKNGYCTLDQDAEPSCYGLASQDLAINSTI